MNPQVSNPNDFKVVDFTNKTDFDFTPEMGCMFDSRPIFGISGQGIKSGESIKLPYHVGQRLATNLAKVAITKRAPATDPAGIPTGVPLWDSTKLEALKNSYITDLYSEAKPAAVTEVDALMAKVEALNKLVTENIVKPVVSVEEKATSGGYQDKQSVIAELTKRGISFDPRASRAVLLKLLA